MAILVFAGLAEELGVRTLPWPARAHDSIQCVRELEQALREAHPALESSRFRMAVNQRYAQPDDAVADHDEVALIPPVSGG